MKNEKQATIPFKVGVGFKDKSALDDYLNGLTEYAT